jgi:hypothetical protein
MRFHTWVSCHNNPLANGWLVALPDKFRGIALTDLPMICAVQEATRRAE